MFVDIIWGLVALVVIGFFISKDLKKRKTKRIHHRKMSEEEQIEIEKQKSYRGNTGPM